MKLINKDDTSLLISYITSFSPEQLIALAALVLLGMALYAVILHLKSKK